MIQQFYLSIKNFFNSRTVNYHHPLSADELQSLNTYLMNHMEHASFHSHNGDTCRSPKLHYTFSYGRNYITSDNGRIIEGTIQVPVFRCDSCHHFHALLPLLFISPYCQYSIPFILSVLYDKYCLKMTAEKICSKYNISISTLYRWIGRFSQFLRIYLLLRNRYRMSFLETALCSYEELLNDIFDICSAALFQKNRILSSCPSGQSRN